jgi:hypothetical protein
LDLDDDLVAVGEPGSVDLREGFQGFRVLRVLGILGFRGFSTSELYQDDSMREVDVKI